jgi:hypothetical protein
MKTEKSKWTVVTVIGLLALWFLYALIAGARGVYEVGPSKPPLAFGLSFALPILLGIGLYRLSPSLRAFARSLDLRLVTALHFWRIIGLYFLFAYAQGLLPAGFAFPAGLGDIAIAVTAIPMARALGRNPSGARKVFTAWNLFGLADLLIAVATGVLHSASSIGLLAGSGPTTAIMTRLPMLLVPTFFVPLFILLHLIALARRSEVGSDAASAPYGGLRTV